MNNKYIGQPCTSCRSVMKEGEDIVVCPICGSPYHKDCYKAEGKCIRDDLHASDKEWQPECLDPKVTKDAFNPSVAADSDNPAGITCPMCGTANSPDAAFCSKCGTPVNMSKANPDPTEFFGSFANAFNRSSNADSDVDGNTVSEYTRYIGSSFMYYLPKFLRFGKSGSKVSFNVWAFFFPNLYFLFRKMNLIGYALLILTTLMSIPSVAITLAQYGYITAPWALSEGFILLNNVFAILSYVISFICGIFGNWFYYKKAKKDIKKIKAKYEGVAERNNALNVYGGTSLLNLGFGLLVELGISLIISFVLLGGIV